LANRQLGVAVEQERARSTAAQKERDEALARLCVVETELTDAKGVLSKLGGGGGTTPTAAAAAGDELLPAGELLHSLEQALNQRDEAIGKLRDEGTTREAAEQAAATHQQRSQSLVEQLRLSEERGDTVATGFEEASVLMVGYTNKLESELNVATRHIANLEQRASHFEKQHTVQVGENVEQQKLIADLLADLDRQRKMSISGNDAGVALLRAKQREQQAHAALTENYRAIAMAGRNADSPQVAAAGQASSPTDGTGGLSAAAHVALSIAESEAAASLQLPAGWESAESPEGLTYFINHRDQSTTWVHPGLALADISAASGAGGPAAAGGAATAASAGARGASPVTKASPARRASFFGKLGRRGSKPDPQK